MAPSTNDVLTIGELSRRTGLPISAIRFYEARGLIEPHRSAGGTRRFLRSDIRRLSFVLIAQRLGLSIAEIAETLRSLPHTRTPTAADWASISARLRVEISSRIALMEQVRDQLDSCIGCGCLSLSNCGLYNPGDRAGEGGSGPRYLTRLVDQPEEQR